MNTSVNAQAFLLHGTQALEQFSASELRHHTLTLLICKTPQTSQRAMARQLIREALAAYFCKLTDLTADAIQFRQQSGKPLQVDIPHHHYQLAISHESGMSIAAVCAQGPVGADIMRVPEQFKWSDWAATADLYLGKAQRNELAAYATSELAAAFTRTWVAHEARLKCHGLELTEWTPGLAQQLASCQVQHLDLHDSYYAAIASEPPDSATARCT